jgi:hypothetical protein
MVATVLIPSLIRLFMLADRYRNGVDNEMDVGVVVRSECRGGEVVRKRLCTIVISHDPGTCTQWHATARRAGHHLDVCSNLWGVEVAAPGNQQFGD